MKRTLFLDALASRNQAGRPPVWLMRQAGRYLEEYRALRKRHDFLTLCYTPELIVETTLLPLRRFDFDAAIVFSDILLIARALGMPLRFEEGVGPIIDPPLAGPEDLQRLSLDGLIEHLAPVCEAIRILARELSVPLIGFAGAPFTVASYLIEGRSNARLEKTKKWLLQEPDSFSRLLDCLTTATTTFLNAQIAAGVDAIQLFDSWIHPLAPRQVEQYVLPDINEILDNLAPCPTLLFARGSAALLPYLAACGTTGLSLDWQCDMAAARYAFPDIVLQGNLDPDILEKGTPDLVREETQRLLESMQGDPAFICNLGHGILPHTPIANVHAFLDTIRRRD